MFNLRKINFKFLDTVKNLIRNTSTNFAKNDDLGLESFLKTRDDYKNKNLIDFETLKKRLNASLNKKRQTFNLNELKILVHLSTNDNEIDLLRKVLKEFVKSSENLKKFNVGPLVLKLFSSLDRTKDALEFFNDKDLKHVFASPSNVYILMVHLLKKEEYEKIIELFYGNMKNYDIKNFNLVTMDSAKNQKIPVIQAIPLKHFDIVTISLFKLNTMKSLETSKDLLKISEEKNSKLGNVPILRIVLLAIYQNQVEFALELLHSNIKQVYENSLIRNLLIISYSKEGNIKKALNELELLLQINSRNDILSGKLFPYTVKCFKDSIYLKNENDLKSKFEKLNQFFSKRVTEFDINEFFYEFKYYNYYNFN